MTVSRCTRVLAAACLIAAIAAPASAQITTGNISGTIKDAQGGVIPGATVILVNEAQRTKSAPSVTNATGDYVFPNVTGGTYTVEVSMTGFKLLERAGVIVSGGDRVVVPTLTLEVGGTTETVSVVAESPVIQAASGERSFTIMAAEVQNLPIANRGFRDFVNLMPGVNPTGGGGGQTGRLGGGGQDNIMMDGISIMDTGNNGLMGGLNIPVDMIAEVKVLTSGYNAEYGRSSGLQISAVTRGGSNRFRGSIYDVERNSDWYANRWDRIQNDQAKPVVKERDFGYTVGGPVGKPGGSNRLFFFYSQEYRPRTMGNDTNNFRLPTALERRGDFSETRDQNGNLFNLIYDASTGQPKTNCSATIQTACFADGGVVGRIPIGRLYGPGMALLSQYPLPNVQQVPGQSFNYQVVTPVVDTLQHTPALRMDYQVSNALRLNARWTGRRDNDKVRIGSLPGFNDTLQAFPWAHTFSATINYSINATTFLEATYGMAQNRLGTPNTSEFANRNNVKCPADFAALVPNCTLGAITYLYPDAGIMDPRYYETQALAQVGFAFFQDGRSLLPPQLNWGAGGTTSRVSNSPPSLNFPGFMNINRTQDVSISMTKIMGRHTLKAGFYLNHSYKAQNQGGAPSFQGALNFGNDANNPLDAAFPFANAALGIFSSYGQSQRFMEGSFIYDGIDWYVQDNWKVNSKLTLDYGLRFVHQGEQYDQFGQSSNFFADQWTLASAPFLYVPGCAGASPCTGNNRQAMDPRTNTLLGPGTSSLIGTTIVNSGNVANGVRLAGDGISDRAYQWPDLALAPRFGGAYDLTGQQKMVLRGSIGLFFDRPDGNTVFSTVANPPLVDSTTSQWGSLGALGASRLSFGPVPTIQAYYYDSKLPSDTQWNFGFQMALPWASSIDVEYVGHHSFDVLGGQQNGNAVQINAIDLGATLRASGQDPTQAPGTSLPNNLLRPFRGYNNIQFQWGRFERTYHSIQTNFARRFRNGVSFGVNWTLGLSDKGTTNMPNGNPQLRFDHAADGSFTVRADQATAEKLFADQGLIRHILQSTFVWDLPDWKFSGKANRVIGLVLNDWQLSGIFRADSGTPYDVGFNYGSGGGVLLTGSPDYSARVVINGDPGNGCSSNQYKQFNTEVFSGALPGSVGLESGRNYLSGCNNRTLDLAIARTIRLGGGRSIQLRADVFNAPNAVMWNGRSTTVNLTSPTVQTVTNPQYLADGSLDQTRLTPNRAGFGAVNGVRDARTVQLQIRFQF